MELKSLLLFFVTTLWSLTTYSQTPTTESKKMKDLRIGVNFGIDVPNYGNNYDLLTYRGGIKAGAFIDYYFLGRFGLGADYDFIANRPKSLIPNNIYMGFGDTELELPTARQSNKIYRQLILLGPIAKWPLNERMEMEFKLLPGIGFIKGGDILVEAEHPDGTIDQQQIHTGYDDAVFSMKGAAKINFRLWKGVRAHLGLSSFYHFNVKYDEVLDLNGQGDFPIVYGENQYDRINGKFYLNDALTPFVQNHGNNCFDLRSIGLDIGVSALLNPIKDTSTFVEPDDCPCTHCCCPNDKHTVMVTVKDERTGTLIPNADVVLKDMFGNPLYFGVTNNFGVANFGEIKHGDYLVEGKFDGVATANSSITKNEFTKDAVIRKVLLYQDKRFYLRGVTIDRATKEIEPGIPTVFQNVLSGSVRQKTSDAKGEFGYHLDPDSNYKIWGIKEEHLSNIEHISTMRLNRDSTFFVELELPFKVISCGEETALDVFFDFDKAILKPVSYFELDRIVRYMRDHPTVKSELAAHTDCRGDFDYNLTLSQKRAQVVVDYLSRKGIRLERLTPKGYGEMYPKSKCKDCDSCSSEERELDRRTEIKLDCN